jgi:hypothetical protein
MNLKKFALSVVFVTGILLTSQISLAAAVCTKEDLMPTSYRWPNCAICIVDKCLRSNLSESDCKNKCYTECYK